MNINTRIKTILYIRMYLCIHIESILPKIRMASNRGQVTIYCTVVLHYHHHPHTNTDKNSDKPSKWVFKSVFTIGKYQLYWFVLIWTG